jgi:hypothetical protein
VSPHKTFNVVLIAAGAANERIAEVCAAARGTTCSCTSLGISAGWTPKWLLGPPNVRCVSSGVGTDNTAADIRWALESLAFERAQREAEAERKRVELAKCWSASARDPVNAMGRQTGSFFSYLG